MSFLVAISNFVFRRDLLAQFDHTMDLNSCNNTSNILKTGCPNQYLSVYYEGSTHFDCYSPTNCTTEEGLNFSYDHNANTVSFANLSKDKVNKLVLGLHRETLAFALGTTVLKGGEDSGFIQKSVHMKPGKQLVFDLSMFLTEHIVLAETTTNTQSSMNDDNYFVHSCSYLHYDSDDKNDSFAILSQSAADEYGWSAAHWLDVCGHHPVTVYTWSLDSLAPNTNETVCNVRYVTNSHHHNPAQDDTESLQSQQRVVCLEDFLVTASHKGIISGKDQSLTYVSSLGTHRLLYPGGGESGTNRDALSHQALIYFDELVAVVRAFQNIDESSGSNNLHVRSLISAAPSTLLVAPSVDTSMEFEDRTISSTSQRTPTKAHVSVLADGESVLLIYVLPEHVHIAQAAVEAWQWHCEHDCESHTRHMYVKHLIIPIGIRHTDSGSTASRNRSVGDEITLRGKPSLRVVLRSVSEIIRSIVTVRDVVFVLVGLEALLSSTHPLDDTPNAAGHNMGKHSVKKRVGVIPSVKYGGTASFRLDADVMVAAASDCSEDPNTRSGRGQCYDFNAFVGVGVSVLEMITVVQHMPGYVHASDESIASLLALYARENPQQVMLDREGKAFRPTAGVAMVNYLSFLSAANDGDDDNEEEEQSSQQRSVTSDILSSLTAKYEVSTLSAVYEAVINGPHEIDSAAFAADIQALLSAYRTEDSDSVVRAAPQVLNPALFSFMDWAALPRVRINHGRGLKDGSCSVDFASAQAAVNYITSELLQKHRWFADAFLSIAINEQIKHCVDYPHYVDTLATKFIEIAKYSRLMSYYITHAEYRHTAALLQYYDQYLADEQQLCQTLLEQGGDICPSTASDDDQHDLKSLARFCAFCSSEDAKRSIRHMLYALRLAQPALHMDTAHYTRMVQAMTASVTPARYSDVQRRRAEWQEQQLAYAAQRNSVVSNGNGVNVHYVTFASDSTPELANLLVTAKMAGVDLQVLGLGEPYSDYTQKIVAYYKYLRAPSHSSKGDASPVLRDDDVIVLLDAYDVLLLPQIRNIGEVIMRQSATPILFCAESGIYPEYSVSQLYARGRVNHSDPDEQFAHMTQKFLNSGCIAGRVGQVRHVMEYTHDLSGVVRDDQQILVRYMLEHPDMASLDVDHIMFLTTFKATSYVNNYHIGPDLRYQFRTVRTDEDAVGPLIGLIHCNNKNNNQFYNHFSTLLVSIYRDHYMGLDAEYLLRAVRSISDGDGEAAYEALNHVSVARNRTSLGGANSAGDYLMSLLIGD